MTLRFDTAVIFGRHLIDPRGRCDRRAMLLVTVSLLAVQALLAAVFGLAGGDLAGRVFFALNLPLMWIGTVALLKRLHDVGYSGWWIGPAVLFWLVGAMLITLTLSLTVGPAKFSALLQAYPPLHGLLVVVIGLPPFGGLLWLQASAGQPGANRFGPQPSVHGFAAGHPKGRAANVLPAGIVSA
jgi:uncharacterized membrane protein YhaH (DUF805 family)